ncbi:Probable siderophore transport system ATP-binding protein YusV [uncultured Clostridium sp.]|uniref:ABC transporter ATP-binding protein n=1 Tax=uncultured Clostridium sp. TaxID=59620 RepID=UPI0008204931|nr:ABC transporter ATP-binding protein [uncultured Clostridium sp.]SCK03881.1 Probable siderophore transport system ATP-binding protein YusV [uncultured Clostridium sp.]
MKSLIHIDNIKFSYDEKEILKGITLNFNKGKFYSIIGPNGCGKTTLIKNISSLLSPNKNTVFIDNKDLISMQPKEIAKILASVPQNIHINYEFKVYDIVMMGRVPHKGRFEGYNSEDKDRVKKAMKKADIWKFRDKLVTELSGGELQRVIAARALAQDTDIILLDEPTSHLDLQYQIEFLKIFKDICNDKVIIAVLHDLNLVSLFSDEIIMLKDGEVIDIGEADKVMTKENIKKVYNIDVDIYNDNNKRYILPII